MKLKFLLVVGVIAVLMVTSVFAVQKMHRHLAGPEGEGEVYLQNTRWSNGEHNTIVKIKVDDLPQPPGMLFEGWLVDTDTDYKLSIGVFGTNNFDRGKLTFRQHLVNFDVYDKVVITKEPIDDTDPRPGVAVLEATI